MKTTTFSKDNSVNHINLSVDQTVSSNKQVDCGTIVLKYFKSSAAQAENLRLVLVWFNCLIDDHGFLTRQTLIPKEYNDNFFNLCKYSYTHFRNLHRQGTEVLASLSPILYRCVP